MCVVRPSIIGSAWREPVPGWVDTVSAGGAMYLSGGLGLLPVMRGRPELIGDQVMAVLAQLGVRETLAGIMTSLFHLPI